eukprot:g2914.t1
MALNRKTAPAAAVMNPESPRTGGSGGGSATCASGMAVPDADSVRFGFMDYLRCELSSVKPSMQDPLGRRSGAELMLHFLYVPFALEPFLTYGSILALDSFLDVFTLMPLRLLRVLFLVGRTMLNVVLPARLRKHPLHRSDLYVALRGLLVATCCYALEYLDMSYVYHYMKSQTFIKLYVMFNILDMLDKLFAALGQDILDALYTTSRHDPSNKVKMPVFIIMAIVYMVVHSLLVFVRMVALSVACNSSNATLLTLLISNNFVELKSSVFKRFEPENLFQISCSDVVERFQIWIFLFMIGLQNASAALFPVFLKQAAIILLSELGIDSVKHCFIIKFNHIDPKVYNKFTAVLRRDVLTCRSDDVILDHTHVITQRLGLAPLPTACVLVRLTHMMIKQDSANDRPAAYTAMLLVLVFLNLLAFKVFLGMQITVRAVKHTGVSMAESPRGVSSTPTKGGGGGEGAGAAGGKPRTPVFKPMQPGSIPDQSVQYQSRIPL